MQYFSEISTLAFSFFTYLRNLNKAIYDDDLVYFLLPSSYDTEKFILSIYDINKLPLKGDSLRYNFRTSYSQIGECTVDGAYKVIAALHSCIKNDYSIGKDIMILPDNVHDVFKARWHHSEQNWKGEREALLTADSLGNPAAAYYLALLFERGYGEYPRTHQEDADNYWRKAASNGCRSAKMHIARSIIMDSLSSTLERGIAVDYLYEVANPNTIALSSIWEEVYESNALLDYYYRSVGNGNKSYEITKRALANNNDPRLLGLHLDNCLRCGKYDEALTLVRRGKQEGNIMAYFIHAKMLTSGLGVKKDLKKAQRIVKYVLDEFDEPLAYHYLAEIYKEEGKDLKEVAYIDSLSSIDFKRQLR